MAKQPDLNRLIKVTWGVSPFPNVIFFTGGSDVCNCDITASNDVEFTNKTMDYNKNTFLNFPSGGASDLSGLNDVNIDPTVISHPINDGMPLVYDFSEGKWKAAGYDGKGMTISAQQFRMTKDNGTPIYIKFNGSLLSGSSGTTHTYKMPDLNSAPSNTATILTDFNPVVNFNDNHTPLNQLTIYQPTGSGNYHVIGFDVGAVSGNSTSPSDNPKIFRLPGIDGDTLVTETCNQTISNKQINASSLNNPVINSQYFDSTFGQGTLPQTSNPTVIGSNGSSGKIKCASNTLQAPGVSTATIGTLTGKPGSTSATDAAGWVIVTIGSTDYAMPLFAL